MKTTRGITFAALVVGCGGGEKVAAVTVQPLPRPSASIAPIALDHAASIDAFLEAGCKRQPADASFLDCKGARIDGIDACRVPLHVLPVRFEPRATVAECFIERAKTPGVRRAGCMLPMGVRLIAATRRGFVTIDSPDALAKEFAPVTSPDEAIAFAMALTGSEAVEPGDADAKNLGTTDARADGDAFRVRLYAAQMCGCEHPTNAIDYEVTRDGAVREVARKEVWRDPKMNGLCVD